MSVETGARPLGVGLAGCGRVATEIHLPILARMRGVRVIAVADAEPQRLAAAARRVPGALLVEDYRALLEAPGVEAVVVCLPNELHADAAVETLRAGRHLYLEKPLAPTLAAAEPILAAWQESGRVGMIGFNFRFDPAVRALKRQLERGTIGEPVGARSVFSVAAADLGAWRAKRERGGGVLLDLASHHVDLLRFVFGREVRRVACALASRRSEDDVAALQLWLEGNLPAQGLFTMCSVEEDVLEVHGRAGKLAARRQISPYVQLRGPTLDGARVRETLSALRALARQSPVELLRGPSHLVSFRAALRHFVECARTGRPASPDLLDGYRSLAVIEAAHRSASAGGTIETVSERGTAGRVPRGAPAT